MYVFTTSHLRRNDMSMTREKLMLKQASQRKLRGPKPT